ncbi:MAG: PIN domain-containing protein [Candidatus Methanoperedens sp.]|nr:PIN domain-containing protein [Candidatus Methanoperedens sp.]MCZ7359150.1 PIN domain-containing protein [Candidatus Methanoperedens sp.]HLB72039.1 PIN domain-containing protein [Candidatus Methanoperedens sp.]
MRIYLDTGFFIALSDARDKNHTRAKMYLKKQVQSGARFVTGRNVVVEYIDGVTKRVSKIKAIEELENILSSKLLVIEPVIEQDWDKAIMFFKKYNDQQIDLTDCLSFAVMERLEMNTALTFDNDFKIHGFEVQI